MVWGYDLGNRRKSHNLDNALINYISVWTRRGWQKGSYLVLGRVKMKKGRSTFRLARFCWCYLSIKQSYLWILPGLYETANSYMNIFKYNLCFLERLSKLLTVVCLLFLSPLCKRWGIMYHDRAHKFMRFYVIAKNLAKENFVSLYELSLSDHSFLWFLGFSCLLG